jgi:hypothetical protein
MDLPPLPQPQPLGADEIRSLDQWELDDRVWLGLLDLLRSRPGGESESEVIMAWPSARRIYFLTRSLEWEVANGGFNQYWS